MIDIINRLERGLEPAIRPLGAAIGRTIVDMAAPAAPALKPYVRADGTKVPHMFVDPHGRMVNLTPTPSLAPASAPVDRTQVKQYTPEVAPTINYTTWKKDPPAEPGWYIASVRQKSTRVRYWNGKFWSTDIALASAERKEARDSAMHQPACLDRPIEWLRPLTLTELGQD